jgi:hypothetical protein
VAQQVQPASDRVGDVRPEDLQPPVRGTLTTGADPGEYPVEEPVSGRGGVTDDDGCLGGLCQLYAVAQPQVGECRGGQPRLEGGKVEPSLARWSVREKEQLIREQ